MLNYLDADPKSINLIMDIQVITVYSLENIVILAGFQSEWKKETSFSYINISINFQEI